jgi:hypothetical protein
MEDVLPQMARGAWIPHWQFQARERAQALDMRVYVFTLTAFDLAIWIRHAFVLVQTALS